MKLLGLLLPLGTGLLILSGFVRKVDASQEGNKGASGSNTPRFQRWGDIKSRLMVPEAETPDDKGSASPNKLLPSERPLSIAATSSGEESGDEPEDLLSRSGYHAASYFLREDGIQDAVQLLLALSRNTNDARKLKEGVLEALSRYLSSDSAKFLDIFRQLVQNQASGETLAEALRPSNLAFALPKVKEHMFSTLTGINDRDYLITVARVMGDYFGWNKFYEEPPRNVAPEKSLILRLLAAINLGDSKEVIKAVESQNLGKEAAAHVVRAVYDNMTPVLPNIPEMWEIVNALASATEIPVESMNLLAVQYLEEMSKENDPGLKYALTSFATHCPSEQVKSYAISQIAKREVSALPNVLEFVASMIDDKIPANILRDYMKQVKPRIKNLSGLGSPDFTKKLKEALSSIKKPEALLAKFLLCKNNGLFGESKAAKQLESVDLDKCQRDMILLYDAINRQDHQKIRSLKSHLEQECANDYLEAAVELGLKGNLGKSSKAQIRAIIESSSRKGKAHTRSKGPSLRKVGEKFTSENEEEDYMSEDQDEGSASENEEESSESKDNSSPAMYKHKPKIHQSKTSKSGRTKTTAGRKATRTLLMTRKKRSGTRTARKDEHREKGPRFWIVSQRDRTGQ